MISESTPRSEPSFSVYKYTPLSALGNSFSLSSLRKSQRAPTSSISPALPLSLPWRLRQAFSFRNSSKVFEIYHRGFFLYLKFLDLDFLWAVIFLLVNIFLFGCRSLQESGRWVLGRFGGREQHLWMERYDYWTSRYALVRFLDKILSSLKFRAFLIVFGLSVFYLWNRWLFWVIVLWSIGSSVVTGEILLCWIEFEIFDGENRSYFWEFWVLLILFGNLRDLLQLWSLYGNLNHWASSNIWGCLWSLKIFIKRIDLFGTLNC